MKQKVVIIGHGYTSRLGIIRSLAPLDCEITVIAMVFHNRLGRLIRFDGGKPIDCYSKYVHNVLYCYAKGEDDLIHLLLNRCIDPTQKVIIIPDSDFSSAVIDRNQELLKDFFLYPNIHHTPGAVEYWMNKTIQKQQAKEVGLNVTGDCTVSVKSGTYIMPENVKYPCFTKPLATISGGKGFLRRCDREEDLRGVLDMVGSKFCNTEVLVEDYMSIDKEYAVVGFSDSKDVFIPGVIEFLVNSKSHMGIAREGIIKPIDGFESIIEQFKVFVRKIGFNGLFDIDFYESGGRLYFSEMNFRFGGSGYAYTVAGANLPAMMVRSFNGERIDDLKQKVTRTSTYVNERMCLDDYLHGFLNENEVKEIIGRSDIQFIVDGDDIAPFKRMKRELMILKLKRIRLQLKKLIK